MQQNSETKMTASILKSDPNTQKVCFLKKKKKKLFSTTKHSMQMLQIIPFIKLQNDI